MAATDTPSTLTELRTDFLEAAKEVTGVTTVNTVADRYLNRANAEIHAGERWWWQERAARIITHPGYSTGTVAIAVATSRIAVTGSGTLWNTAVGGYTMKNAQPGGKIVFAGEPDVYPVSAVGSDTALTLGTAYVGTTDLTAATYVYFEDEYALEADFDDVIDARTFSPERKITLIGPRDFYRQYGRTHARGTPGHATLIEIGPGSTATLRRRVLFGSAPDRTYTIPYRYYTMYLAVSSTGVAAVNLSASTDQPIIPVRFRPALVQKALELFRRERHDDGRADTHRGTCDAILARARAQVGDASDRPRLTPAVAAYWRHARRPYSGGRGSARYDVNDRFDHLEM